MKTFLEKLFHFRKSNAHQLLSKKATRSAEQRTALLLGVRFFAGTFDEGIDALMRGGLAVFPSGPGLAQDFPKSEPYRQALQRAALVFGDSGAMVILWRLFAGGHIPRYSGLRVLQAILKRSEFRHPGATFWVMPSSDQMASNLEWLNQKEGIPVERSACYIAPHYGNGHIEDPALLARIEQTRPSFVVLCIGGGVQERVGLYLQESLSYRPTILCIGAAIGFLTGVQSHIPTWADRAKLGWCVRCLRNPKIFVPRYTRALELVPILFFHWLTGLIPGARKTIFPDEIEEMTEA